MSYISPDLRQLTMFEDLGRTTPFFIQILLATTKQLYEWYFSVCPFVTPFDYIPIIVSSWDFQEFLPITKVRSMQKVKIRLKGQGRTGQDQTRPFPDRNSSLNSYMMMKWRKKLDVA